VGEEPRAAATPAEEAPTGSSRAARTAPLDPEQLLGSAEAIHRDQLAIGARDERFASDRQVGELKRAIALYQQFIDRAGGDPRYVEAVRRSQQRIDDAKKTIEFLLGGAETAGD
jgi:hypothetical protein